MNKNSQTKEIQGEGQPVKKARKAPEMARKVPEVARNQIA